MARILRDCIYCKKPQPAYQAPMVIAGNQFLTLHCGHTIVHKLAAQKDYHNLVLNDDRKLRDYQAESCEFAERANFRVLIAHEPGLGKTIISLALLKEHPEELLPCAILVKPTLISQWFREVVGATGLIPQVIKGKERPLPEFFQVYIISQDLLRNAEWLETLNIKSVILDECQQIKNPDSKRTNAVRKLCAGGWTRQRTFSSDLQKRQKIKTIALDLMKYHGIQDRFDLCFEKLKSNVLGLCECRQAGEGIIKGRISLDRQHAENDPEDDVIETILHEIAHAITPGAGHSKIWAATCLSIGGDGKATAHCNGSEVIKNEFTEPKKIIALSGTPIKNNAGEYFPVLNLLQPERFGSYAEYLHHWVDSRVTAFGVKSRGLRYPEEFKEFTKDFIIRKTRIEAAPELPVVDRQFRYVELEGNKSAYQKEMEVFEEAYLSQEGGDFTKVQNSLFRLKHLVGLDKIDAAVDFASEFLIGTDRKLTIFVHHQDVSEAIYQKVRELCEDGGFEKPLRITSDMDLDARGKAARNFQEDSKYRILIASTLSAGEGLNLQACSDCLFVERQFNSVAEEQAEGRFVRLGAVADKVSATYLTVLGTVDELLMILVEEKRKIVASTLDFIHLEASDNVMRELADTLFTKGLKAWKIK